MSQTQFDLIVHRLQSMQSFQIEQIDMQGFPQPWMVVEGANLMPDLVLNPHTIRDAIDAINGQIAWWGRALAQTTRVVEVRERHYRSWRSRIELRCAREGIPDFDGKVTAALTESYYRTLPEYDLHFAGIEAATEARNATEAIYIAYRAKKDVLLADLRRVSDGSLQRLSP